MADDSFVLDIYDDDNQDALEAFLLERINKDYVSIGDPNAARTNIFFARYNLPPNICQLQDHKLHHLKRAIRQIKHYRLHNNDGGERWIIVLAFFSKWVAITDGPFMRLSLRLNRVFEEFPNATFTLLGFDRIVIDFGDVENFYDYVTDFHGRQFEIMSGDRRISGDRIRMLMELRDGCISLQGSSYKARTITSSVLPDNFEGAHNFFCEIEGHIVPFSRPMTRLYINDVRWNCCRPCKDHLNSMKMEGQPRLCPAMMNCPHCDGFRFQGLAGEINHILQNNMNFLDNLD